MDNQLTGAEIVFKALGEHGVEYIFGYPGGAVLPLYDHCLLYTSPSPRDRQKSRMPSSA